MLVAVVVSVLFLLLNWYVAPTKPSGRKDLVLALAQILGGTALLSGLDFTWRTLQVNHEGQITERFTRAIDQLGKVDEGQKLFEVRVGGIYALERIARESEEDYWPIMEVLTAYVRQHAPWRPEADQQGEEDAIIDKKSEEDSREATVTIDVPALAPDIQAIMTVIRRRTRYYGHGEPEPLDLHETHLSGADLRGADLRGAYLWKAKLWKAVLRGADLRGADLRLVSLSGADLLGADLSGAYLLGADLRGAYFGGADLRGAVLRGADLKGADLSGSNVIQKQLEMAYGDKDTQLPSDLKPPADWGIQTDEQLEGD